MLVVVCIGAKSIMNADHQRSITAAQHQQIVKDAKEARLISIQDEPYYAALGHLLKSGRGASGGWGNERVSGVGDHPQSTQCPPCNGLYPSFHSSVRVRLQYRCDMRSICVLVLCDEHVLSAVMHLLSRVCGRCIERCSICF